MVWSLNTFLQYVHWTNKTMYILTCMKKVLLFDRVGCRIVCSSRQPQDPPPPSSPPPRAASSPSFPSPPSLAIWIESLRSTLLFSSAQLLEMWAPLWRSSTHRGCCLGSSPSEARTATVFPQASPGCPISASSHPRRWTVSFYPFLHPPSPHTCAVAGLFTRRWMVHLPCTWRYHLHRPTRLWDRAAALHSCGLLDPSSSQRWRRVAFAAFPSAFWILRLSLKST